MINKLLLPHNKGLSLRATDGFGQMITNQGQFLYWDPNAGNNTADRMWHAHSEEQLKAKIVEQFTMKPKDHQI